MADSSRRMHCILSNIDTSLVSISMIAQRKFLSLFFSLTRFRRDFMRPHHRFRCGQTPCHFLFTRCAVSFPDSHVRIQWILKYRGRSIHNAFPCVGAFAGRGCVTNSDRRRINPHGRIFPTTITTTTTAPPYSLIIDADLFLLFLQKNTQTLLAWRAKFSIKRGH